MSNLAHLPHQGDSAMKRWATQVVPEARKRVPGVGAVGLARLFGQPHASGQPPFGQFDSLRVVEQRKP